MFVKKTPGSNIRYPDFVGSSLQAKHTMPHIGSGGNFAPPPYRPCHIVPFHIYHKALYREVDANIDFEVLAGPIGYGVF